MPRMVIGLGNPGPEYANTRHNAGFMVVDLLAENLRVNYWKSEAGADVGLTRLGDDDLVLVKPQAFMNVSGKAVRSLATLYDVTPENMIVVHDDLDLPVETVRVKGGPAVRIRPTSSSSPCAAKSPSGCNQWCRTRPRRSCTCSSMASTARCRSTTQGRSGAPGLAPRVVVLGGAPRRLTRDAASPPTPPAE